MGVRRLLGGERERWGGREGGGWVEMGGGDRRP